MREVVGRPKLPQFALIIAFAVHFPYISSPLRARRVRFSVREREPPLGEWPLRVGGRKPDEIPLAGVCMSVCVCAYPNSNAFFAARKTSQQARKACRERDSRNTETQGQQGVPQQEKQVQGIG